MRNRFSYLRLGEPIDESRHVLATFYVESDKPLLEAAEAIAAESSVGTWTDVTTASPEIFKDLAAKIYHVDEKEKTVKIAYPLGLFEEDNLPQLFSDVCGNIFGMKDIIHLRVRDIEFPEEFVKANYGPALGINGIRRILGVTDRPLLGSIIKPKVGLSSDEHAKVAYEAWVGGVDVVKDDETLTDQKFNPFEERIVKTLLARMKAEEETGEKKIYVPNVTARLSEMVDRARFVKAQGGRCIMVDIITVGWSGVQYIREQNLGMIIHGHRAMHGAFTHDERHGIAMLPIAKAARLAGIDQLHTGTVIGKMEGTKEDVQEIDKFLKKEWFGVKTTMPIASGGLHPGHVAELVRILGKDVIINMGGGIHGHPGGTLKGAMAARQALDATVRGVSLSEYAENHPELAAALGEWGEYGKEGSSEGGSETKSKDIVTYTHALVQEKPSSITTS